MNDKSKFVTWLLLAGILWELSKMAPASPSRWGQISCAGACGDGPCGCNFPVPTQQPNRTPYWIAQMRCGNGAPFTFEAQ